MDLSRLFQVGSAAGGAMPDAQMAWQKVLQGRLALQQAQRQQQAQEALFASLITPAEGAVPQQGPPGGMPAMQQPQAPPMAGPGGPPGGGAGPIPAPGPASLPSAPASPAAQPASGASVPAQPAGGVNFPDPMSRLRQMAQAIKRGNPGIDNATAMEALDQQVKMLRGLAPEDRAVMQAQISLMKSQEDWNKAQMASADRQRGQDTRLEGTRETNTSRETVARDLEAGRNERTAALEAGRNTRAEAAEAGKNTRAQARIEQSNASTAVKAQYKQMQAQRAAIKDQISAFNAGTPGAPKKEEVAKLQAQLKDLDGKMAAFWSRNQQLPRPSELDRLGGADTAGAAVGALAGGAPAASPASSPAAAPAVPARPQGVPETAQYSPSQKSWWWQENGEWKSSPGS